MARFNTTPRQGLEQADKVEVAISDLRQFERGGAQTAEEEC